MDLAQALEWLLVFAVLPLWLLAGMADWLCHRASCIESTSGSRESLFHLLLHAEIALPVMALLLLQATLPVLLLAACGVLAHFLTSWIDTRFAQPRRFISPTEQMVHSFLEMLPLFGLVLLALLHRGQLKASDWNLVARDSLPAGTWWIAAGLCAGAAFIIEEWWRGRRHANSYSDASRQRT